MKTRICTKCSQEKPLEAFNRDTKGREGRSARCAVCKNSSRKTGDLRPVEIQKPIIPMEEAKTVPSPIRIASRPVPLQRSNVQKIKIDYDSEILKKLSKKFGAHLVLSIGKDFKTVLHVQQSPSLTFKALDPDLLLQEISG